MSDGINFTGPGNVGFEYEDDPSSSSSTNWRSNLDSANNPRLSPSGYAYGQTVTISGPTYGAVGGGTFTTWDPVKTEGNFQDPYWSTAEGSSAYIDQQSKYGSGNTSRTTRRATNGGTGAGGGVSRMGDPNNAVPPGVIISSPQNSVIINGVAGGVVGSILSKHPPDPDECAKDPDCEECLEGPDGDDCRERRMHVEETVIEGDTSVQCGNSAIAFTGCLNSCEHIMALGSGDVFCSGSGTVLGKLTVRHYSIQGTVADPEFMDKEDAEALNDGEIITNDDGDTLELDTGEYFSYSNQGGDGAVTSTTIGIGKSPPTVNEIREGWGLTVYGTSDSRTGSIVKYDELYWGPQGDTPLKLYVAAKYPRVDIYYGVEMMHYTDTQAANEGVDPGYYIHFHTSWIEEGFEENGNIWRTYHKTEEYKFIGIDQVVWQIDEKGRYLRPLVGVDADLEVSKITTNSSTVTLNDAYWRENRDGFFYDPDYYLARGGTT